MHKQETHNIQPTLCQRRTYFRLFRSLLFCFMVAALIPAAFATNVLNEAKSTLGTLTITGGGIFGAFGLVTLGLSIKDHNGPGIGQGIFTIIGGAMIIAAGGLIKTVS